MICSHKVLLSLLLIFAVLGESRRRVKSSAMDSKV